VWRTPRVLRFVRQEGVGLGERVEPLLEAGVGISERSEVVGGERWHLGS